MLPRSKLFRAALLVAPVVLVALLWNAARKRPRFVATPAATQTLALSHDGNKIAAALGDGSIAWSERGSWKILPLEDKFSRAATALQFSRDGKALFGSNIFVPAQNQSLAYAWDLPANKIAWTTAAEKYEGVDNRFNFSHDGQKLGLLVYDVVKVLDVSGAPNASNRAFPTLMRAELPRPYRRQGKMKILLGQYLPSLIALSADGAVLVVADRLQQLQFWDVATGQLTSKSTPAPYALSQMLAVSPNGRFVASSDFQGVAVWDNTTQLWTHLDTGTALNIVAWMPDSNSLWLGTRSALAISNGSNKVRQLSAPALKTLRILPTAGHVAVSGDGETLATSAQTTQNGVWLWNID